MNRFKNDPSMFYGLSRSKQRELLRQSNEKYVDGYTPARITLFIGSMITLKTVFEGSKDLLIGISMRGSSQSQQYLEAAGHTGVITAAAMGIIALGASWELENRAHARNHAYGEATQFETETFMEEASTEERYPVLIDGELIDPGMPRNGLDTTVAT